MPPDLVAARPSFEVDGQAKPDLSGGLVDLRVEETVEGLYACEATFANWGSASSTEVGFLLFDRQTLDFGKELVVEVGSSTLFRGRVIGIEAAFPEGKPPTLTVLAEDRFQDLRMTRRTRTFADSSDSDVFNQIAGDHSLTPDVDLDGPTHKVLAQLNQSDLAFMRERARAVDAELWVDDRTLKVRSHASRGDATVSLAYGNDLREFVALADLAEQRSSVNVTGWDVSGKQGLAETADDSAISSEVGSDDSGPSILASALSDRKETVVHSVPLTSDEAHARAEALLKRRARRFVVGRGVADGNADLRVGVKLTLDGLGPLFSGDFYVAECRHVFDERLGFRTEFAVERPGIGRPS